MKIGTVKFWRAPLLCWLFCVLFALMAIDNLGVAALDLNNLLFYVGLIWTVIAVVFGVLARRAKSPNDSA